MTPPNPGKGYRLLKVGEVIDKWDQVNASKKQLPIWPLTTRAGAVHKAGVFIYRRKLKTKAKHGAAKSKM